MPSSQALSEAPKVWAIPVAEGVVALWTVLPSTASDVLIATGGQADRLWFKRRLIVPGFRLHLFVIQARALDSLDRCRLGFRDKEGASPIEAEVGVSLADWRAPGAGAVVRAIAAALSDADEPIDATPFARALSIMAAWCVPCRYHAGGEGVSLAVFEFVPARYGRTTFLTARGGAVRIEEAEAVGHDADSVALLWRGEAFDRAFVEVDGDFLELRLDPPRRAAAVPLPAWIGGLEPAQLDGVLEAWSCLAAVNDDPDWAGLGQGLPLGRELQIGADRVAINGLYNLGDRLILSAIAPQELTFRINLPGSGNEVTLRRLELPGDTASRQLFHGEPGGSIAEHTAARLTVAAGDTATSCWLGLRSLRVPEARDGLRASVAWEVADEALVAAFARSLIDAAVPTTAQPPLVVLSDGEPLRRAPLVICHFDGDEVRLRATLLALRLSLGRDLTIRLVHGSQLSTAAILSLRSLCRLFSARAELVCCGETPIGHGFGLREEDSEHSVVILMSSGVVPLDAASWSKAVGRLARSSGVVYWQPPSLPADATRAVDYLTAGAPAVMASVKTAAAAFTPQPDLLTFEGVIRRVLSRPAPGVRAAEPIDLPAMYFSVGGGAGTSYGDVRLDDAVIDAMLAFEGADIDRDEFEPKLVALRGVRVGGS